MIWPPGKSKAVALVGVTYAVALGVAVAVGLLARELWPALHPLWVVALADLAATVVVFVASVLADNSSFYDPYWSLQPLAIAGYLLWLAPASACGSRQLLVVAPVVLWGARLTFNWLRGWRGLGHEDWRYVDIRGWSGRWYWPTTAGPIAT